MTRKVVLFDVHGRIDAAREVLQEAGALDENGNRVPDVEVIQNGDIMDIGYGKDELDYLNGMLDMLANDTLHCGNHEGPAFGLLRPGCWGGYDADAVELWLSKMREGRFQIASAIGDWLVTHAGVNPYWLDLLEKTEGITTAQEVADYLNSEWEKFLADDQYRPPILFNGSTMRGFQGVDAPGVLWQDLREMEIDYEVFECEFKQVVGHTPMPDHPTLRFNGNVLCGDSYNKVVCVWTDDDGETWHHAYRDAELVRGVTV